MNFPRIKRSPFLIPSTAIAATVLLLAANPARAQLLDSLLGRLPEPLRLIPLAPTAMIPTLFAKCLWGCVLLGGCSFLRFERFRGKALAYGIVSLGTFAMLGLVLWTTTIGWWASSRWSSDGIQGWFGLAFLVAYLWAVIHALRWWMRDLVNRCPECLDRCCMPVDSGAEGNVLVATAETEAICIRGHGAMRSTRWSRSFHPATGFWRQLLG